MTTLVSDRPTVSRHTFTTRDPAGIRALLGDRLGESDIEVRRGPSTRFRETALDTPDRRFARAGYRLSARETGGRTDLVLEPVRHRRGHPVLRIRAPWPHGRTESLPEDCPDALREPVQAVAGRERVTALSRASTLHETWQLLRDDHLLGTITLQETREEDATPEAETANARVEIELADDEASDAAGLLARIRSRLDLTPAQPAREAPLAALPDLGPAHVDRTLSAQETAFAILRLHFARMLVREPGARLGADPEELHDLRVAIRRLRAALRLYARHLPGKPRRHARELRRLGRALGPVRDLDVQIGWLREHAAELPRLERDAVKAIVASLQRRRRGARAEMLEALDSPRSRRFVERFARYLRRGPTGKPRRGRRPIGRVAPRLVKERMKALLREGARIDASSPAAEYHGLRILAKKARYAVEFHARVYGKPARRMIRRLVRLQDELGEHQDASVFLDHLRSLLEDDVAPPGTAAADALDALAERRLARARELRARYDRTFARVRGKRWKRLRRELRG